MLLQTPIDSSRSLLMCRGTLAKAAVLAALPESEGGLPDNSRVLGAGIWARLLQGAPEQSRVAWEISRRPEKRPDQARGEAVKWGIPASVPWPTAGAHLPPRHHPRGTVPLSKDRASMEESVRRSAALKIDGADEPDWEVRLR